MKTFLIALSLAGVLLLSGCAPGPIAGPTSGINAHSPHNSNSEGTRRELQ